MIVDGQQRVSVLYAAFTGKTPDMKANRKNGAVPPTDLAFNPETETFERLSAIRRGSEKAKWLEIATLRDVDWRQQLQMANPDIENRTLDRYVGRIQKVLNILEQDLKEQTIPSSQNAEHVTEMFVRMNQQGKKVQWHELEIARLSIDWPEAASDIETAARQCYGKQSQNTFQKMDAEIMLRGMIALSSGRYTDGATLAQTDPASLPDLLERTRNIHNEWSRVLNNKARAVDRRSAANPVTMPAIAKFLDANGGQFPNDNHANRALAWHLETAARKLHKGHSAKRTIDEDLACVPEDGNPPWDNLQAKLGTRINGAANISSANFEFTKNGGGFYHIWATILQLPGAHDWYNGSAIRNYPTEDLEKHHIIPKNLVPAGCEKDDIANITLLSRITNQAIGDRNPAEYLAEIDDKDPGLLEQHAVTRDRNLWLPNRYQDFLKDRRQRLADAANHLLRELRAGRYPQSIPT